MDERRPGGGRFAGHDRRPVVVQPGRYAGRGGLCTPLHARRAARRHAPGGTGAPARARFRLAPKSARGTGTDQGTGDRPRLGPVTHGEEGNGNLPGGEVGQLVASAPVPAIVDADGLNAIGSLDGLRKIVDKRDKPTVITPHDGELTRLAGAPPGPDRVAAARQAAARSGAIVLLKGSTTVVAEPGGRVLLSVSGTSSLATAGTGDVLSGVVGAFVAQGVPAWEAAALAAHVHGRAARQGHKVGLVASDLPELVAGWLSGARTER